MYRVYSKNEKKWIKENIYLSPNPHSDLYIAKKSLFGRVELMLVSDEDYVIHKNIDLCDKNGFLIYEGDYLEARVSEDRIVRGLVTYAHELSSYIILCFDSEEYFTLGTEVCDLIEVVGNVFDSLEENNNGQQSLQEEKV